MKHPLPIRMALLLLAVAGAVVLASCGTRQKVAELSAESDWAEHSPSVLIVMYDPETGKEPLQKAIREYKAEVVYDYSIIPGMAIKKPANKTLEETRQYFRKVEGVVSVEYDRIYHLDDPVRPTLEIE